MHLSIRSFPLALAVTLIINPLQAMSQQPAQVSLMVDAAGDRHPIDPNVYGIQQGGLDPEFAKEIKLPNTRWGGDDTTRYNWQVDSSNDGADFYFLGGNGEATPTPSAQVDTIISNLRPAGTSTLITIPIIPYINSTSQYTCSYRVSVYGPQQATNPYFQLPNGDQCGNGVTPNGDQILDTNIYYNHIDNTPNIQADWINHLKGKFGEGKTGAHYFQLDNEPSGWGNTHVDVEPNGVIYDTIIDLGQKYASMIKHVVPNSEVMGPSDFTLGGWIGDQTQQNGLYAGQYYLQAMKKYQHENGVRLIDYFDEHYYNNGTDTASELAITRSLWDPTFNSGTWVEQFVFDGPMQLIPRFKSWIQQYYPGTRLAISEYGFGYDGTLVGALTEADALGIFGRQGLDFANMFTVPDPKTDPVAYSFRLYRNYDGKGGEFGDVSVQSQSSDQGQLAIYSAIRHEDNALTLVIINKTSGALTSSVNLSHFTHPADSAEFYNYSNANLTQILQQTNIPVERLGDLATGFTGTFPALSASVVVIRRHE
jgi:Glycoside hydrolase family 44